MKAVFKSVIKTIVIVLMVIILERVIVELVVKNNDVYVSRVSGDIFEFRVSGKSGLINVSNGEVIVNAKNDFLSCTSAEICKTETNNVSRIIDIKGNVILGPLDEGVKIEQIIFQYIIIRKDHQFGVIDMQGKIVIDYLPLDIRIYDIDYTNQIVYIKDENKNKYGFINLKENLFVEPVYEHISRFVDKISVVKLNSKYGFVNDKNEVIINFIYDRADNFNEGLASVQYNSKFGYIDKLGNVIIDFQYDSVDSFRDGVAHIEFGYWDTYSFTTQSEGFINKNNERIIPIHNSNYEINYKNEYDSFGKRKYYFVNKNGSVFYKNWDEDYGLIIDGTKIINQKGNVIIDRDFNDIQYISDNMFCIHSSDWECYNMIGEKLIEYPTSGYDHVLFENYSPYVHLANKGYHYIYDDFGKLIYKSNWNINDLFISQSNKFIITTKNNEIISYNISTKDKKVIYKNKFTIKSLFSW